MENIRSPFQEKPKPFKLNDNMTKKPANSRLFPFIIVKFKNGLAVEVNACAT